MTEQEIIKAEAENDARVRAKYNYIRKAVNVDEQGNRHVAYFREPNRMVVGMALAEIEKDIVKACEYIFDDAVIREESDYNYFRDDHNVFYGLLGMLQGLVRVKKSTFTS